VLRVVRRQRQDHRPLVQVADVRGVDEPVTVDVSEEPGTPVAKDGEATYKLVVTATDITRGRMLRLPWDYHLLSLDPDRQLVANAVRASISIPLFFEPVTLRDAETGAEHTLVDGGVLSNFPIEIFDRTDAAKPRWPTLGVKVIPDLPDGSAQLFPGLALPLLPPVHLLEQVVTTAIIGHDQTYVEQPCVRRRAIRVDASAIGIVEFNARPRKRDAVVAEGERAAREFLAGWDWERFKDDCTGERLQAPGKS